MSKKPAADKAPDSPNGERPNEAAIELILDSYAGLVALAAGDISRGRKTKAAREAIDGLSADTVRTMLLIRTGLDAQQQLGLIQEAGDEAAAKAFADLEDDGPVLN